MTRRRNSIVHLKDYRKFAPKHVQSLSPKKPQGNHIFFKEGIVLLLLFLAGMTSLHVFNVEAHKLVEKNDFFHQ